MSIAASCTCVPLHVTLKQRNSVPTQIAQRGSARSLSDIPWWHHERSGISPASEPMLSHFISRVVNNTIKISKLSLPPALQHLFGQCQWYKKWSLSTLLLLNWIELQQLSLCILIFPGVTSGTIVKPKSLFTDLVPWMSYLLSLCNKLMTRMCPVSFQANQHF